MIGGSLENDNYQQLISNQHIRTKTGFGADTFQNNAEKLGL